jgi:hypothetical protein
MKKNIYNVFIVAISLLATSCKKFVEIGPPKTQLVSTTVFQSDGTATSALISIYVSSINQTANPYIMALYPGLSADELKSFATTVSLRQIYTNTLNPLDGKSSDIWTGGYNCIYQANAVIEGCKTSKTLSPNVKKRIIAEALFLRAFWQFYLLNEFGDIPIVITTDYNLSAHLSRSNKDSVYEQIISDLKDAQSDLSDNYVDGSSTNVSIERVRVNKSAATALLARVYLFTGNYAEAEAQATRVIDNRTLYEIVNLDDVFKKNSKEAIWQLMKPLPTTQNTPEGANFILTTKPATNLSKSSTISESLLSAFEAGDNRKVNWIGKITNSGIDYYFPYKYKVSSSSTISEYSMVLRLAEQYLIRAEARAQLDDLTNAISDIDVIRNRAGLPLIKDINPNINKQNLIDQILKERRIELFTEWGHRWMDLKRTGKIDAVMTTEAIAKGSAWDTRKQYYPIPESEINNNSNLIQNPGYN